MNFDIIETDRLFLRKLTPEGHQYIFKHYALPEIKSFFGIQREADFEKEKLRFEKGMTTYNRSFVLFHLLDKNTGAIMGACGFHNWLDEHKRAEVGYALLEDRFKQKGYMKEALKPIIDYGFHTMNLNRIEACIGPENEASQRLVERLGFQQEGIMKQHFIKDDIKHDSLIFALLRSEYDALK